MVDDPKHAYAPDPTESLSAEESFFGRWSRLKRSVDQPDTRRTEETQTSGVTYVQDPKVEAVELEHKAEEVGVEHKTDEDMPPLESLDENSDYGQFFSPKVSETLRKAALRKLFAGAMFNVRDGLDDYDDDFRTFAALGDIITADMRTQAERKAQQSAAAEVPAEAGTEAMPESPESEELLASTAPEPETEAPETEAKEQEIEVAESEPDAGVTDAADAPEPQTEPQAKPQAEPQEPT